ncbi:hypothetical protein GGX14DRAFT_589276 [Mycena pura]|uniref:Uncharacterized protein n=1 Tax=Mycena pura TaxID=153505 RepID=A0AAD6UYX0_9AGAR|nr:hypothetical protein GGX14DRAFT_589276 [Mycena pura]
MNANGPRPSILQLFDPLSSRDTHSPDSDKENAAPVYSGFFPKPLYQHPSHAGVRLTRRLVDVGDVTVQLDDVAECADEGRDEYEGGNDSEDDTVRQRLPSLPPSPRTPLGDVTSDRERTPVRSKDSGRHVCAGETAAPKSAASSTSAAPCVFIHAPDDEHENSQPAVGADALSTCLATPTGSLIADTILAFPTPSEASLSPSPSLLSLPPPPSAPVPQTLLSTSSINACADLHTSFALHMDTHSDEASFDLLNDKISFLGYEGDEESFDMGSGVGWMAEKEIGASPLIETKTNDEQIKGSATPETAPSSPLRAGSSAANLSRDPSSYTLSATTPAPSVVPFVAPTFATPLARQLSPIRVLSTNLPAPPRLVPALKIVKRKRPDAIAIPAPAPKIAVAVPPLDSAPSSNATASSTSQIVGQYVMEGPGPRRVPNRSNDKPKAAGAPKPLAGATVAGPRRVPISNQGPAPVSAPAPKTMGKALASARSQMPVLVCMQPLVRLFMLTVDRTQHDQLMLAGPESPLLEDAPSRCARERRTAPVMYHITTLARQLAPVTLRAAHCSRQLRCSRRATRSQRCSLQAVLAALLNRVDAALADTAAAGGGAGMARRAAHALAGGAARDGIQVVLRHRAHGRAPAARACTRAAAAMQPCAGAGHGGRLPLCRVHCADPALEVQGHRARLCSTCGLHRAGIERERLDVSGPRSTRWPWYLGGMYRRVGAMYKHVDPIALGTKELAGGSVSAHAAPVHTCRLAVAARLERRLRVAAAQRPAVSSPRVEQMGKALASARSQMPVLVCMQPLVRLFMLTVDRTQHDQLMLAGPESPLLEDAPSRCARERRTAPVMYHITTLARQLAPVTLRAAHCSRQLRCSRRATRSQRCSLQAVLAALLNRVDAALADTAAAGGGAGMARRAAHALAGGAARDGIQVVLRHRAHGRAPAARACTRAAAAMQPCAGAGHGGRLPLCRVHCADPALEVQGHRARLCSTCGLHRAGIERERLDVSGPRSTRWPWYLGGMYRRVGAMYKHVDPIALGTKELAGGSVSAHAAPVHTCRLAVAARLERRLRVAAAQRPAVSSPRVEQGHMAATHFPGNSTKTIPATAGRHDGHQDDHLNCIAIRHGWTRTFSISPEELAVFDYDTLERILEVNTLRIRPMGLRIFVEQPADSGAWSKIRSWKHDTSLQTILVQKFFEDRRAAGVITRFDVRDGNDRRDDSDTHSLRSVGSRIVHGMHHRGETGATSPSPARRPASWFGTLIRRGATKRKNTPAASAEDEEPDERVEQAPEPPPKQSTSIFAYLNPLALFSSSTTGPEGQTLLSPEEARTAEVESLRKRGWAPPGLARRQKSLRERLRASEGRNPFLGGSRLYHRGGGKKRDGGSEGENPFADPNADVDADAAEITPQEVDEFFEIDRTSSIMEMNNRPVNMNPAKEKTWSRFKSGKNKKNKGKQRGELGGSVEVVRNAVDAFPNSPHHSQTNVGNIDGGDDE